MDIHETCQQLDASTASDFHVEVSTDGSLSEDSSIDSLPYLFDGPKKRADTAETETSFPPTASRDSIRDDNDITLEGIGSYDEDECVIWYADHSLSLSEDQDERNGGNNVPKQHLTLPPLDTESVFTEAETMLASHKKPTIDVPGYSVVKPRKCNKKVRNTTIGMNSTNKGTKGRGFLARSRKFFSLSKVPASIAEEPCSTPSSTSASAPASPC
jgi:hypothetical protein